MIMILDQSAQAQGLPEWAIIVFAVIGVVIVVIVVGLLIGLSVLFLNRSRYISIVHSVTTHMTYNNCVCCGIVMVALMWKT